MSRFAQYYAKYKHDAGCYDWEQRQQHLGALFEKDESILFYMGEDDARKVYKHRVYHLGSAPGITVMRFANDIDIPVERDFEPAMAKDEPSCFVIIDNRDNLRTVAIQKRKKAFSNTRHRASPCLAGPRLFPLRHAQLPEHHPQGYHVRSGKIAPLSLSSLKHSPSAPDLLFPSASDLWFQALPRAFSCRFSYLCQTKLMNNEL